MTHNDHCILSRRAQANAALLWMLLLTPWAQGLAADYPPPPGDYPVDDIEVVAPYAATSPKPDRTGQTSSRMLPLAIEQDNARGPFDGATLFGGATPTTPTPPAAPVHTTAPPMVPTAPAAPAPPESTHDLPMDFAEGRDNARWAPDPGYPPTGRDYPHDMPTMAPPRQGRVPGAGTADAMLPAYPYGPDAGRGFGRAPMDARSPWAPPGATGYPADPYPGKDARTGRPGRLDGGSWGRDDGRVPEPDYAAPGPWGSASGGPANPSQPPAAAAPTPPAAGMPQFRPPSSDTGN